MRCLLSREGYRGGCVFESCDELFVDHQLPWQGDDFQAAEPATGRGGVDALSLAADDVVAGRVVVHEYCEGRLDARALLVDGIVKRIGEPLHRLPHLGFVAVGEDAIVDVQQLVAVFTERLNSELSIKDAFKAADNILCNAAKSISELITIEGSINLDFRDVETTMREGGGAIMAIGRARGERRVEKAIVNALESPLLYGSDISNAKKILFNIYTSEDRPLFVSEMREIDSFMYGLNPNIDVIWGTSDDNTLGEDAKVIILATGIDNRFMPQETHDDKDEGYYNQIIAKLYREPLLSQAAAAKKKQEKTDKEKDKNADITDPAVGSVVEEGKPEGEMIGDEMIFGEDKAGEESSPSVSFNMSDSQTDTAEPQSAFPPRDGQKAQSAGQDGGEASPVPDHSHPKAPSFLDRLKQHLKKGLTDLTRDIEE